jgi:predicted HTH transcriptional regulator
MAEIKLFISSVQKEFANERRQLCDYIRTDSLLGQFFVPFIFEDMPATDLTAQKAYLQQAADCDIYLGIFGTQYGYEDEQGISPTEREYDTASAHFAHRLTYTLRTVEPRHPKEQAFINKVEHDVVRRSFETYEELRTAVYNSLVDYLVKKEIIRRVPFDAAAHQVATYDDIDMDKVRTFVNRAKEKRNFPLNFEDGVEKIFSAIHVLTDDGRLTNSALLLFAKDPQRFFRTSEVRCAQFYGNKVEKPIRNYQVYSGSLFEMIDKAVGFVMSRIDARVGTRDHSTDAPVEYELPESAVAEAIANAVAHRDYTSNASVQVMLFRDRLEVWNPGKLPDGFTVQKLREVHSSEPANPVIAHPLFLAGYIEHLGTGTTDMIAACEQFGLRTPEFQQTEDFRTIIYRAEKVSDTAEKVTEQGQKSNQAEQKVSDHGQKSNQADPKSNQAEPQSNQVRLTAKQRKVLDFCDETPRTAQEILEMLGVQNQNKTRQQYTTKLVLAGLLRPTTTHKNDSNRRYITAHPSTDR